MIVDRVTSKHPLVRLPPPDPIVLLLKAVPFLSSTVRTLALAFLLAPQQPCHPQSPAEPPLPDIVGLMHQVEQNQQASEATLHNYLYTTTVTFQKLDGHGDPRKITTIEREVFYINNIRLERTTRKDGKELTPDEQRKEADRLDKDIARARQKPPPHQETITFARFLALGSFSNERRLLLRGRSTIALDYTGDPKAKTQTPLEGVIHDMAGTVWVDEQDRALSRVEGRFLNNFRVAGGLIFSVARDTAFTADWTRVNGEVWLPSTFTANGSLRALLFVGFNGRVSGTSANYRRFRANSTILPGVQQVQDEAKPTAPQ